MTRLLLLAALLALPPLAAGAELRLCFNYGCASEQVLTLTEDEIEALRVRLALATDAESERVALAQVVGVFYAWAGERSPIGVDRAGDLLDDDVHGRMDCIDHAITTTRVLEFLQSRAFLRFHQVGVSALRRTALLFEHHSAVIAERVPPRPAPEPAERPYPIVSCDDCRPGPSVSGAPQDPFAGQYVVDSWFVEPGEPAVVLPMAAWLDGEGPNVQ